MSHELARAHVYLSGMVQGVGMRAHVRSQAMELSLKGWVRNLSDGRVEAVLEGPRTQIEKLLENLKEGSYRRYVQGADVRWEDPLREFNRFEIRF